MSGQGGSCGNGLLQVEVGTNSRVGLQKRLSEVREDREDGPGVSRGGHVEAQREERESLGQSIQIITKHNINNMHKI